MRARLAWKSAVFWISVQFVISLGHAAPVSADDCKFALSQLAGVEARQVELIRRLEKMVEQGLISVEDLDFSSADLKTQLANLKPLHQSRRLEFLAYKKGLEKLIQQRAQDLDWELVTSRLKDFAERKKSKQEAVERNSEKTKAVLSPLAYKSMRVDVGTSSHFTLHRTSDGRTLLIFGSNDQNVYVLDPVTQDVIHQIPVGAQISGDLAVFEFGGKTYALFGDHLVNYHLIDIQAGKVVKTTELRAGINAKKPTVFVENEILHANSVSWNGNSSATFEPFSGVIIQPARKIDDHRRPGLSLHWIRSQIEINGKTQILLPTNGGEVMVLDPLSGKTLPEIYRVPRLGNQESITPFRVGTENYFVLAQSKGLHIFKIPKTEPIAEALIKPSSPAIAADKNGQASIVIGGQGMQEEANYIYSLNPADATEGWKIAVPDPVQFLSEPFMHENGIFTLASDSSGRFYIIDIGEGKVVSTGLFDWIPTSPARVFEEHGRLWAVVSSATGNNSMLHTIQVYGELK